MIDARIPLGYRPVAVQDPVEAYAQGLTLQSIVRQRDAGDLALARERQQMAEEQAFREALGRGATLKELAALSPERAIAWQRSQDEQLRMQAQAQAQQEAMRRAKMERLGRLAETVADEPSYRSAVETAAKEGLITAQEAETYRNTPWSPEVQARLKQIAEAVRTPQERIAQQRLKAQQEAEAYEPRYKLGDLLQNPGQLEITPRTYGSGATLLNFLRPRPTVGQNWQTGTMTFSFPNPVDRTVQTVETQPGTIAARPRQGSGSVPGGGRQKPNPFPAIEAKKQWDLQQAERRYLDEKGADPEGALKRLEAAKARAQFNYEQAIRKAGGTVVPQAGNGTVKMRAPNGEVADVPANLVDHYQRLGAKRL